MAGVGAAPFSREDGVVCKEARDARTAEFLSHVDASRPQDWGHMAACATCGWASGRWCDYCEWVGRGYTNFNGDQMHGICMCSECDDDFLTRCRKCGCSGELMHDPFTGNMVANPVYAEWDRARQAALVPGAQVRMFGLMTATEHNGKQGRVTSLVDSGKRLGVLLEDGKSIAARRRNVRLV